MQLLIISGLYGWVVTSDAGWSQRGQHVNRYGSAVGKGRQRVQSRVARLLTWLLVCSRV